MHEEEDMAPVSAEYLPATQPMHTRDEAGRNDPAEHFGHSVDGPEYDEIAVLCDVLSGTQTRPGFECSLSSLRKHTPRHTRHAVPSHPAPVRQMVCGHVHVREVCIPHPLALGDETETTKPVPSHLVLARVFSSPAPATCPAPISFSTLFVTW